MKNPHIRPGTLPSERPWWVWMKTNLYGKRFKKARRLWLRGEGPRPLVPMEIGRIERVTIIESDK